MHPTDDDWAVFWCHLLGPILLDDVEPGERRRFLRELSQREVRLPTGRQRRISLSTLRRKVRQFQRQKLAGLQRQRRSDRGQSRKDRQAMIARALELKRQQPLRSPKVINKFLEREFGRTIPKSTLNRHLRWAGATRRQLQPTQEKIRCRWTRDHSNALWVGDFAEGPYVFQDGHVIKSHLSIWIDCHSRYVVEGRYYFRENLDILIDSLLRAWASHGASRELYVDNAKIYHARALKLACPPLNIELLHRPPKDPPAGGIIERMIQTTQLQFEAEIRASHTVTLDKLNHYFQAWLHEDYHQTVHGETEQTPHDRFLAGTRYHRQVNMAEALELFHLRERRKVDHTFCDVRVNSQHFAVSPKYRYDHVVVHYDPFGRREEVKLYSLEGVFLQVAPRYDRSPGAHPFLDASPPTPPTTPLDHEYLQMLSERHQENLKAQSQGGVNYHRAQQAHILSLARLANKFAQLLGRRGGASGLSAEELERLASFHRGHPRATAELLEQACAMAEIKTIPVILFQLQQLLPR
jgi:transposase InsO family protein